MNQKTLKIILIGLALFVASSLSSYSIVSISQTDLIWFQQVVMKCLLLLLSLFSIRFILKASWSDAGFKKPAIPMKKAKIIIAGMILGAFATLLIFITPAKGYAMIKQLSLIQFFLIIVFWSSVVEEIFIRGFIQTGLKHLQEKKIQILRFHISQSILISALIFAGMHLSLLFFDVDYWTVLIVVLSTFLLGLVAGYYREKYDSILPAIITHMFFNVGGIVGGIPMAILYRLLTGELPPH